MKSRANFIAVITVGMLLIPVSLRSAQAEPATIDWSGMDDEPEQVPAAPKQPLSPSEQLRLEFFRNVVKDLPPDDSDTKKKSGGDAGVEDSTSDGSHPTPQPKHLKPSPWGSTK